MENLDESLCDACTSLRKDVIQAIGLHSKAVDATAEGGEGVCIDALRKVLVCAYIAPLYMYSLRIAVCLRDTERLLFVLLCV